MQQQFVICANVPSLSLSVLKWKWKERRSILPLSLSPSLSQDENSKLLARSSFARSLARSLSWRCSLRKSAGESAADDDDDDDDSVECRKKEECFCGLPLWPTACLSCGLLIAPPGGRTRTDRMSGR